MHATAELQVHHLTDVLTTERQEISRLNIELAAQRLYVAASVVEGLMERIVDQIVYEEVSRLLI